MGGSARALWRRRRAITGIRFLCGLLVALRPFRALVISLSRTGAATVPLGIAATTGFRRTSTTFAWAGRFFLLVGAAAKEREQTSPKSATRGTLARGCRRRRIDISDGSLLKFRLWCLYCLLNFSNRRRLLLRRIVVLGRAISAAATPATTTSAAIPCSLRFVTRFILLRCACLCL